MSCKLDLIPVLDEPRLPFSASLGTLYPILAQNTTRYDVVKTPIYKSRPIYMPPQWSAFLHPEGKEYFYRDSGLPVVTEAHIHNPEIVEKVCVWAAEVERQTENRGFALDRNIELFLEIDGDDCGYYLVDRATATLFWLTDYTTTELGLESVVSDSHLKLLLEAQYWSHIENFCMHFGGLPRKAIDDLILVFLHALGDNLTSNSSTFPYTAAECEKFLKLLNSSKDRISEGHVVAYVGRIWSVIFYNRYETHYGQEQSRLSRDCAILPDDSKEMQWTIRILSMLSFRTSDRYLETLDALFVDKFVYGHAWTTFMGTCLKTWRRDCCASAMLLLLNLLCFSHLVSTVLAFTSSALASASLLTGILLIHRHEGLEVAEAHEAHAYLSGVRSKSFKFQGVAAAYSIPRVLLLVGCIAFFSQCAVLVWENNSLIYAIPLISLILAFFLCLRQTIATSKTTIWGTLTSKTAKFCSFLKDTRI